MSSEEGIVGDENLSQIWKEMRKATTFKTDISLKKKGKDTDLETVRFNSFSSWFKVKRPVSNCIRLTNALRYPKTGLVKLDVVHLDMAENILIKTLQREHFVEMRTLETKVKRKREVMKSNLGCLNPFLDMHGILRVGGRLKRWNAP